MIKPARTEVTTPYGKVAGYPVNNGFHEGVDFSNYPDKTVLMPETGVVQVVPWNGRSYEGNCIIIQVGNRRHILCHLSKFLVTNGQTVAEGTPVGIMGNTGYAIGIHLHWGLRVDGQLVNPLNYTGVTMEQDIQNLYKILDTTNKNVDRLYKIVDQNNKNLDALYKIVDNMNKRLAAVEGK